MNPLRNDTNKAHNLSEIRGKIKEIEDWAFIGELK
jgi:hypothetical protein